MLFKNLHFHRYFLQRKNLLPLLDAYTKSETLLNRTDKNREDPLLLADEERKWADLRSFLGTQSDDLTFERNEQESEYLTTIDFFNKNGSSVFSFNNKLIEMLGQTDVDGIPIETLRLPFRTQYFYLGDSDFLPEFSKDYKIDGFYLHEDSLEHTLQDSLKDEYDLNESKPFLVSGSDEEWQALLQGAYKENQVKRNRHKQFKENINSFDYLNDWYTLLCINFTFSPRNNNLRPLLGQEILSEPVLKCVFEFATHKTTVGEAIEYGFREGLPTETADQSVEHKNSYLNVINKPEYLGSVVRLVFNLLAYLNWKDRDVVYRYSNEKIQGKMDKASTDKQLKRSISKAESAGFKKIYICGQQSVYPIRSYTNESAIPRVHWRRGHWRNQRYGEKLANNKLVWIKPTLVNKEQDQPLISHIYAPK